MPQAGLGTGREPRGRSQTLSSDRCPLSLQPGRATPAPGIPSRKLSVGAKGAAMHTPRPSRLLILQPSSIPVPPHPTHTHISPLPIHPHPHSTHMPPPHSNTHTSHSTPTK